MSFDLNELLGEYAPDKITSDVDSTVELSQSMSEVSTAIGPAEMQLMSTVSKALIDGLVQYGKVKQEEETKRVAIRAELKRQLHIIDARKEFYSAYLKGRTSERIVIYQKLGEALNTAVKQRDLDMVSRFQDAILKVYNSPDTNMSMPQLPLL